MTDLISPAIALLGVLLLFGAIRLFTADALHRRHAAGRFLDRLLLAALALIVLYGIAHDALA